MNLINRVERLESEAGLNGCPCRILRQIEYVTTDDAPTGDGCARCGRPLPITRIEAVRPQGERLY